MRDLRQKYAVHAAGIRDERPTARAQHSFELIEFPEHNENTIVEPQAVSKRKGGTADVRRRSPALAVCDDH